MSCIWWILWALPRQKRTDGELGQLPCLERFTRLPSAESSRHQVKKWVSSYLTSFPVRSNSSPLLTKPSHCTLSYEGPRGPWDGNVYVRWWRGGCWGRLRSLGERWLGQDKVLGSKQLTNMRQDPFWGLSQPGSCLAATAQVPVVRQSPSLSARPSPALGSPTNMTVTSMLLLVPTGWVPVGVPSAQLS